MGLLDKLLGRGKEVAAKAAKEGMGLADKAMSEGKQLADKAMSEGKELADKAGDKLDDVRGHSHDDGEHSHDEPGTPPPAPTA